MKPRPTVRSIIIAAAVYFAILIPAVYACISLFKLPDPAHHAWVMAILIGLESAALIGALMAYHRSARRTAYFTGTTYCGHCGKMLKGLSEPKCPGCRRPL